MVLMRLERHLQALEDVGTCGSGRRGSWCSGEADINKQADLRRLDDAANGTGGSLVVYHQLQD